MILPAEANRFYNEGMTQLDHLAIGENPAKTAILANMVMGQNVLFYGPVGGSKTTLAQDSYRLIDGIELSDIADIPPSAELSGTQLGGGTIVSTKEIVINGGEPRREETSSTIQPIIPSHTKVIRANEVNRANPHGLNVALEALEQRYIVDAAGETVHLKDLQYTIATMNPSASRMAVFPVDPALASRHSIGVELGRPDTEQERDSLIQGIIGGFRPNPGKMEPVIDIPTLVAMRESAPQIPIPTDYIPRVVEIVKRTNDRLRQQDLNVDEADGRMAKQIATIAKTLAFLGAEERVGPAQLKWAVRYVVGARLGGLTLQSSKVRQVTSEIVS